MPPDKHGRASFKCGTLTEGLCKTLLKLPSPPRLPECQSRHDDSKGSGDRRSASSILFIIYVNTSQALPSSVVLELCTGTG